MEAYRSAAMTVMVLFLTAGLSGCVGGSDAIGADNYEEAKTMTGDVIEAQEDSTIRLGFLAPSDPMAGIDEGENHLAVLLFDAADDEPVTDATINLQVEQSHGDLIASVQNPTHSDFGVYEGSVDFPEDEGWNSKFQVSAGGETLTYCVHFHVGHADHVHEEHECPEDHEHEDGDGHDH